MHDANQEILKWDRRGHQAWEDAEDAVAAFTTIPVGQIAAPPMPGVPVPAPTHSSGGWLSSVGHFLGGVPGDLGTAGRWVIQNGPGIVLKAGEYTLVTAGGPIAVLAVSTVEGTKLVSQTTGDDRRLRRRQRPGRGNRGQGMVCYESTRMVARRSC